MLVEELDDIVGAEGIDRAVQPLPSSQRVIGFILGWRPPSSSSSSFSPRHRAIRIPCPFGRLYTFNPSLALPKDTHGNRSFCVNEHVHVRHKRDRSRKKCVRGHMNGSLNQCLELERRILV